jgi:hypothetical protein
MEICECTNCNWTGDVAELKDFDCPKCGDSVAFVVSDTAEYIERLRKALTRSLSWLSSYPGGLSLGAYDEARAALDANESPSHTTR